MHAMVLKKLGLLLNGQNSPIGNLGPARFE